MTYLTDGEEIYNQDQKFTVIKKGKRFGLINSQKEEVLSCEYEIIRKFEDGLFQVSRK